MNASRPKIAFFDFAGCEGCQLTVIDSLQTYPDLLDAVDIVEFREAMSESSNDYQIAFVEGSCARPSDEDRLRVIRSQADLVIALGACAHIGGVNVIRNSQSLPDVRFYVYGEKAEQYETYPARPIGDVIKVDAALPGCPIDGEEFIQAVKILLQGNLPSIPDHPVCVECKLRENDCLFQQGKICLGPIARAGCDARCPSYGAPCEACRGLVSDANLGSIRELILEHAIDPSQADAAMSLFLNHVMMEVEVHANGR